GGTAPAAQQTEGGESQEPAPDPGFAGQLAALLRPPGQGGGGFGGLGFVAQTFGRAPAGGGGGFGGLGGGAPAVASGDYRVSITVDGKTLSRILRVERAAN
ncbi:MAG: hypothetical protein ACREMC_01125, partial [Gemmatimonadales bacterium]